MMNRLLVSVYGSLFSLIICDIAPALPAPSAAPDTGTASASASPDLVSPVSGSSAPEDDTIPRELREKAEFSCLKYAAVRLQDEMSLRVTQVKAPAPGDPEQIWMVTGNKINGPDGDRPVSFSCKLKPNSLPLWELLDLGLYQLTEESVRQMKELQIQENARQGGK